MQGNGSRINIGAGTANPGDVISIVLGLDTRYDIAPGSVRVYTGGSTWYGWTGGTLVALDDGVGGLVGQGAYGAVDGDITYTTGTITVRENADNPFSATNHCWVEFYERFPSNVPADDFDWGFITDGITKAPLILHRAAHSSFASKNLLNHGPWCMSAIVPVNGQGALGEFYLKDSDFNTARPIMSEVAIRYGYTDGADGCPIGPQLIQRCENVASTSRTGYRYGGQARAVAGKASIGVNAGAVDARTFFYNEFWNGSTVVPKTSYNNASFRRNFNDGPDNIPPNIIADDWHKIRMITTIDNGVHLHLFMALGYAEVDNALPNFQTLADVWHRPGNNTVVWSPGFSSFSDTVQTWNNQGPHAYPPVVGRQGLVIGGGNSVPVGGIAYFDDFRCYRMPT